MAQDNPEHKIIKVCIPVSTNMPIEISPASSTIYKTTAKHEISDNALTHIQSQMDILKKEVEKTNIYFTEFIDDIKKKLEHKSIRERDENEILCERIVLLEKENNCLKNEIKNQQFLIQMLTSNENGKTQ